MALNFKLGDVLKELDITKNALAVESKVRPATVATYVNNDVSRIEVETLTNILDALNRFEIEKAEKDNRSPKRYGIEDIISYEYEGA
ncbi:helix-turn-helix domain-containing protein [Bacillus sp. ISL-18]|uniref:helix-turn-helix domain-containing protein n=1 Tax=Bacillus sp. ISL-18 TaxID=2819118 RepID=UPI001BE9CEA0|nr:helix-turn-helix domain-containing protein [Bacillus sp. ISL-18]MBT2653903.1 helix-turn-helix domain-containing protein [Bacillus sp. ISL-18]